MANLKVLHVVWSATIGGIEKLVLDLVSEQKKNSTLEVAVLIARKEGGFLNRFEAIGSTLFADLKSGNDLNFLHYQKTLRIFKRYDVLHFHSFNPWLALTAILSRKKIVYTEHGNFGFGKKITPSLKLVYRMQKTFLNKSVDFISFNSNFSKKLSEQRNGLQNVKRETIYNGISFQETIDKEKTDAALRKKINARFTVGVIARLAGVKKIDRLINAFAVFAKDKDVVLLIIGEGILREELETLVSKKGIQEKTIFAGYLNNVRHYQSLFDVSVFPSQNEAFGLVAIESLEAGNPTIVFKDGGGLAELIDQVEPDDVLSNETELAERLNYYFTNNDAIHNSELVLKRKNFARQFDIRKMEQQFSNIYHSL